MLALPGIAGGAGATLADIEDEVMCPICGTLLELSEAPQAHRQRVYIAELIAAGRSKGEIKEALVAQYGREVLALPRGSGFDLSAYLVPVIAFIVAAAALALAVVRWRRAAGPAAARQPTGPEDEEAARLEADIARYDL
jgi:cytochrome c-type biogenesis protein CcmH